MSRTFESAALSRWHGRGREVHIGEHELFVVDLGRDRQRPPLLVLHGFPTSSFDFHAVVDRLASKRRVVLFDFPGFGLSSKPAAYSYSLVEQAEVAWQVWRHLGIERGHLLAHDYGTSVATELLARRQRDLLPFDFTTVTLCNGSVHLELAQLTVSQKLLRDPRVGPVFARLANARFFKARMQALFADPQAVADAELEAMWEGLVRREGRARISDVSQYLRERRQFAHRWVGAWTQLDRPAHLVWGRADPVAVPAIAEQLHHECPGSTLTWLDSLGHYPMLEAPDSFIEALDPFLEKHDC